jgi:hypothetical protein
MAYTVSYKEEEFVLVSVMSPCTKDDHYNALDQALKLCEQKECSRLLVDLHDLNTETFSTAGCFTFGKKMAERTKYNYLKIAHILPSEQRSKEDVIFTSTVEANRGKTTREFETMEEAKEWLLS